MVGFRHTFFTLLLLLATSPLFGAIEFRTLSVNDGLSQSTVLAIAQDPLGRIWMGTQDGLNCYDGYSFRVYRHVEEDPQSLDDNAISALLSEGRYLWIGTSSGLSCYDASTQRFENFRLDGYRMQVSDIARQGDGNLLLATDLGIVLFDRRSRRLEIRTYLKGISVHTICPSPDGFLVGTSDGVYTYSSTYGNAIRVLPQMARFDVASIVAADGGYWVATHGNGLYRLDTHLQVVERYSAARNPGLVSDYIRVLRRDSEGRLWIGTFDGLSILDPRTGRFDKYVYTSRPGSLSHNSIRAIFIDSQRGVWLGTYYGGVSYYHPLARRFGVLSHDPARNSLGDNTVSCIVEDPSAESLWIGTNDDGVNLYDRRTGRFSEFNTSSGSLLSNNVKCVLPDGRGRVWIGTHAGGLSSMDAATRRVRHYPVNASIPINNSCYALLDGGDQLRLGIHAVVSGRCNRSQPLSCLTGLHFDGCPTQREYAAVQCKQLVLNKNHACRVACGGNIGCAGDGHIPLDCHSITVTSRSGASGRQYTAAAYIYIFCSNNTGLHTGTGDRPSGNGKRFERIDAKRISVVYGFFRSTHYSAAGNGERCYRKNPHASFAGEISCTNRYGAL